MRVDVIASVMPIGDMSLLHVNGIVDSVISGHPCLGATGCVRWYEVAAIHTTVMHLYVVYVLCVVSTLYRVGSGLSPGQALSGCLSSRATKLWAPRQPRPSYAGRIVSCNNYGATISPHSGATAPHITIW